MTTLWISVFASAAEVAHGDPLEELTVDISASSTQSDALDNTDGQNWRRRCRLFADGDCYIATGANPTASATTRPLGAENPEYIDVQAGHKVAVIERT